ncbi:hypothetical protein QAD02_012669 [Eretmocerus hayati]|uniref:Uncharacterized protein n=1 Tax=Eretmocerus hayati TaxID=131215 RepID=A0ACC2P0J9_9HYME|nr:hypothetical protein QAD02_012669 [Eretmocerus hayati]
MTKQDSAPNPFQKITFIKTATGESILLLPTDFQYCDGKNNVAGPGRALKPITIGDLKKSIPSLTPNLQTETTVEKYSINGIELGDSEIQTFENHDNDAVWKNSTEKSSFVEDMAGLGDSCDDDDLNTENCDRQSFDGEDSKVDGESDSQLPSPHEVCGEIEDPGKVAFNSSHVEDLRVQSIEKVDLKNTKKIMTVEKLAHDENCCCAGCHQIQICLLDKMNELIQEVKSLKVTIEKQRNASSSGSKAFDLLPPLSVSSHDALFDLEEKFTTTTKDHDCEKFVYQFTVKFRRYGGSTIRGAVKNIMSNVITDELLDLCTWTVDKSGKIALEPAAFVTVVTDVILDMPLPQEKATIDGENILRFTHNLVSKSYDRIARKRAKEEKQRQSRQLA